MNFLQLAVRTYEECGLVNNPPTSVLNQTGMAKKVVQWVLTAAEEVSDEQPDWKFNYSTTSQVLSSGVGEYDPVATWSINPKRFDQQIGSAYVYKTATGLSSRQWLYYLDWEVFQGLNIPEVEGTAPIYWTVRPDGFVVYHPSPNSGDWTVVHRYSSDETAMAANTDEPGIPAKYQMAIVWRAVMLYCGNDGAGDLYRHAKNEFDRLMERMTRSQTPQWLGPGALA